MLRTAEFSQTPKWVCDLAVFWGMHQEFWAIMYLDFTHFMRDLVRLQCHAGLGKYQEEVYLYISLSLYIYMYIHMHAYTHVCVLIHIHTNTCDIHTRIHTYIPACP